MMYKVRSIISGETGSKIFVKSLINVHESSAISEGYESACLHMENFKI